MVAETQLDQTVFTGRLRKKGEARGICRTYENRSRSPSAIFFLMIFTVAWKTLLGFPQLPPARRRYINKGTENQPTTFTQNY
jgi:hypothetical protein